MERVARVLRLEALTLALSQFGEYANLGEGTGKACTSLDHNDKC